MRKICSKCGQEKEETDFPKNGTYKGMLRRRDECTVCYNALRRHGNDKKHKKFVLNDKNRLGSRCSLTYDDWQEIVVYFGGTCGYCGRKVRGSKLTREHVDPVSQGGLTVKKNIICACYSCNSSKQDKPMEVWYPKQPFYTVERHMKIRRWCT